MAIGHKVIIALLLLSLFEHWAERKVARKRRCERGSGRTCKRIQIISEQPKKLRAALSAASVIAMAGNRIRMAENAVLIIHNPWTIHAGDAAAFRDTAKILDRVKTTLVGAYRKQTGKSDSEVSKLMDAESWYTADEAKAAGFVHEVVGRLAVAAAFDRSRFHAIPEWVNGRFDEQVIATPKLNESRLRRLKALSR